jgi:hypothetical protein
MAVMAAKPVVDSSHQSIIPAILRGYASRAFRCQPGHRASKWVIRGSLERLSPMETAFETWFTASDLHRMVSSSLNHAKECATSTRSIRNLTRHRDWPIYVLAAFFAFMVTEEASVDFQSRTCLGR